MCDLTAVARTAVILESEDRYGSGNVILSVPEQGSLVLTCAHTIGEMRRGKLRVRATAGRGLNCTGTVIAKDDAKDLALVHIKKPFPALAVSKFPPQQYDRLYVVGSPGGLYGTATDVILCGMNGTNFDRAKRYQFTGVVVPGMSGAAMVDRSLQVVGVVTSVMSHENQSVWNVGFAVPLPKIHGFLRRHKNLLQGFVEVR